MLRTQLPDPPRVVHAIPVKRPRYLWMLVILALLAVAASLYALNVTTWVFFGENFSGSVAGGSIGSDRHGEPTYTLVIAYKREGESREFSVSTDRARYDHLVVNGHPRGFTPVGVRYHRFRPVEYVDAPAYADPFWMTLGGGWGGVMATVGLLALLLMDGWGRPALAGRLCVSGVAVPGTVTRKREFRSRPPVVYNVDFTYTDFRGRARKGRTFPPTAAQYDAVSVGDPVTVLLDPRHPDRAVAYECCAFLIEGARPARGG